MKLGEASQEAHSLITTDRQDAYASPDVNFGRISDLFYALSGIRLKPKDIALLMLAVKLARNRHKYKEDNIVDAIGYLDIYNTLESNTWTEAD
jgi:hypothetical protein